LRSSIVLIAACTAALLAASAHARLEASPAERGGRPIMVGAAEDAAKQGDPLAADAKMALARLAGFDTIRMTSVWTPGETEVSGGELAGLQNAAAAASLNGIRLIVSVYPTGSAVTPLTAGARDEFASYAASIPTFVPYVQDVIVGNEPNLNRFWMPQFGPGGRDVAATAYVALLAETYDRLKAVSPTVTVIGGSVSPRGQDNPLSARQTHSPTAFIRDLGLAYRRSGRTRPIMDWLSFHPYEDSSKLPPTFTHPRSTTIALADYAKLVAVLGRAFDGTAQRGSTLPILYDEFGVQTRTEPSKRSLYTNAQLPAARDAVDETTQGRDYRDALRLAVCQKNVVGLLFFHVSDESDLGRWQSGVYYADDTPKSDLTVVAAAAAAARTGTLVPRCPR
jgi:hypothetical protein